LQREEHPISAGVRTGIELNDGHVFIGAEGRFGIIWITQSIRLDIRPVFNYYFISDVTVWDLAGDAIFAFDIHKDIVEPYALAGLNIGHGSFCSGGVCNSDTKAGLNLGGGAKFLLRNQIQPFLELRFTVISDYKPVDLTGGVLFVIK
jgi:hypothetical protein